MGNNSFKVGKSLIKNTSNEFTRNILSSEESRYNTFINIKSRIGIHGYGEMCDFVVNNIYDLLSSAVDKKPRSLQIITDKDFLIALDMCNIELSRDYINRLNRVYRAYVINPSRNVIYNEESAKLMYKIVLKYNKRLVDILMSVGLKEDQALWLVVNRFSSTDERRNIRRMVRAMQHMDARIMTEQRVVDIFSKTFNSQLTNLFCAVMTDRFDSFDDDNEEYVYSTVSNALLDILNTMDVDEIKDILVEYTNECNKSGILGRFKMNTISPDDYGNIVAAVEDLEEMGMKIA